MAYVITVTSQGQISIPIRIREKLGLSKTKKALVSVENGKIVVEPIKDFLELRGSVRTNKKPLPTEELHNIVAKCLAAEYAQKIKETS